MADTPLSGGYRIKYGIRDQSWLLDPDGQLVIGSEIQSLYGNDRQLVLVTWPASSGGRTEGEELIDRGCLIAFAIDVRSRRQTRIHVATARRMANAMKLIETKNFECLSGMPKR